MALPDLEFPRLYGTHSCRVSLISSHGSQSLVLLIGDADVSCGAAAADVDAALLTARRHRQHRTGYNSISRGMNDDNNKRSSLPQPLLTELNSLEKEKPHCVFK